LLKEYEEKKIPYQDHLFPPNENSLFKGRDSLTIQNKSKILKSNLFEIIFISILKSIMLKSYNNTA
jgi:hypothetical protein